MKFLILLASVLEFAAANSARGRIYNGAGTDPKRYPYQVGIQLLTEVDESWCGGTLIGNTWVLTAAHCLEDSTDANITVFLGSIYRQEGEYTLSIKHDDVIIHANYKSDTVENDIALIRIPQVVYSDFVKPAKLPSMRRKNATFVNRTAIATGWGHGGDMPYLAIELQWARFKIISNVKCAEAYPEDEIWDQDLCAVGVKGASICGGDSGGPLIELRSRNLVGIGSTAPVDSCEKGLPSIFTRVTYYRLWIRSKTGI